MNKKKITAIFWFDFVTKICEIIENRNSKLVIFENNGSVALRAGWCADRMELNTKLVSRVYKQTVIQRKLTKNPEDFRLFSLENGIHKWRKISPISIGDDSTLFYV